MHFKAGIIVPIVRATKLSVALLRANTGGEKSDPLNPADVERGGRPCGCAQHTASLFLPVVSQRPVHQIKDASRS